MEQQNSIIIAAGGRRTVALVNPVASVVGVSNVKRSAMVIIKGTVFGKKTSVTRHMKMVQKGLLQEAPLPDGTYRLWKQDGKGGTLTVAETVKPKPKISFDGISVALLAAIASTTSQPETAAA